MLAELLRVSSLDQGSSKSLPTCQLIGETFEGLEWAGSHNIKMEPGSLRFDKKLTGIGLCHEQEVHFYCVNL